MALRRRITVWLDSSGFAEQVSVDWLDPLTAEVFETTVLPMMWDTEPETAFLIGTEQHPVQGTPQHLF